MNKRLVIAFILVALAFPTLLGLTIPQLLKVCAQTEDNPIVFRGPNYQDVDYGNGTHVWRSAPQWVLNESSGEYVPYIFDNFFTVNQTCRVSAGLIGAEFHKGKVVYYDPSLTRLAVERENWLVFKWNDAEWEPVCASLEAYFSSASFFEGEKYVNVTGTWTTVAGNLTIVYHFCGTLKHTVFWTPNNLGKYAVVQAWNGTQYDKVKLHNATIIKRTDNVIIGKSDSLTVLFYNDTQPFGIFENQQSAEHLLHKVMFAGGTVNYQGITLTDAVAWIFYNSTHCNLASGETLTIDPTTYTVETSNEGEIGYTGASTYAEAHDAAIGTYSEEGNYYRALGQNVGTYGIFRTVIEYPTGGIPDGATIDSAKVCLYGENDYSDTDFYINVQNWTEASAISTADYDAFDGVNYDDGSFSTSSWLTNDWNNITITNFAIINKQGSTNIMLRSSRDVNSNTPSGDEYVEYNDIGTYSPFIEITYTTSTPSIGEFQAPSTVYANKYDFLNCTVSDPQGNTTIVNATLEISNDIILKYDNATDTFSEYQDTNNYCILDAANSARTHVNNISFKLSWKVKLNWTYPEGSISVIVTNTKVYDEDGNSGSGSQASLFTFEDDLIIHTDAAVDDSRVNSGQSITFTGTIYYQGTSTVPEDVSGVIAYVELSGAEKGSDTNVASGQYSISFNAESTYEQHSYNVYCITDQNSVTNQTVNVVVDRLVVTIQANETYPWVNDIVNFTLTAVYDYDDVPVTSWSVNVLRNETHFDSGNFTDQQGSPIVYSYTTENVSETTYGLTNFTSNTVTVTWRQTYMVNLRAVDWETNPLTEAIIYMNNGTEHSKTVNNQGWANWTSISAATVNVYATWYGYTVNNTFQITMGADRTVNVTCKCYPLVLDSTRYWIASNATVNTYSWNTTTNKFAVTFSGAINNYTLKSSVSAKPTYVLNCVFDIDTDWTTHLTLNHYGNHTITLAYPNWASTRIYRADDCITSTYWAETEKLYIILTGKAGTNGMLEVYCGSRGTPQATTGLTDPVYFSSTTILAGTYSFASTTTVTLDWTTEEGGSSGGTTPAPSIFLTAETIDVGMIQQGTSKTFNATASWTGAASITIADLTFTGEGSEWLKYTLTTPYTIQRLAIETTGTLNVPITLTVPSQAKLGNYKVLITYKIQVGTSTYETTANIMFTVTSTPIASTGVPQIVSVLLLISLVGIVVFSIKKK